MTASTVAADIVEIESNVRSYSRLWPDVFTTANGSVVRSTHREYIDLFSGAGALNYGHNDPDLKEKLVEYISGDGIAHSLDTLTEQKVEFIAQLSSKILRPRSLDYQIMFTGPTGANAVEAALKVARKATGRNNVVAFSNAFHGVSLGALAVTANAEKRAGAGIDLQHTVRFPFDWPGVSVDQYLEWFERSVFRAGSGVEPPAAVILETVQGEGGLNIARPEWVRAVVAVCRAHGTLVIVDDIQMGCGRTGSFFSFERLGVEPDIVTLSKSLSGFGLPLSVVLLKQEHDQLLPGQHNGTFRGNNHAFVTASAALEKFWSDDRFEQELAQKSALFAVRLAAIAERYPGRASFRSRGLALGVELHEEGAASQVVKDAFHNGLLLETSGPRDEVVKLLPALTIPTDLAEAALDRLDGSFRAALG